MKKSLLSPMNKIYRIFFFLSIIFSIISCDEDSTQLGEDLLPPSDDFILAVDSSTTITASMVPFDTIITHQSVLDTQYPIVYDSDTLNLLGEYQDNLFGKKTADLMLCFVPDSEKITTPIATVDSVIIYLKVNSILLGDPTANLSYKVYQVLKPINPTRVVYSYNALDTANNLAIGSDSIADGTFNFNSKQVKISITDTAFKSKFKGFTKEQLNDSLFVKSFLNGFYIKVEKQGSNGAMAIITTAASQYSGTKMALYYNNGKNSTTFSSGYYSSNNVHYYYNGAFTLKTNIANSLIQTETNHVLVQGMAGSLGELTLANPLETWKDSGTVAINKVEIIVSPTKDVISPTITPSNFPKYIYMYYKKKDSKGKVTNIELATSSYKNGAYVFNITSFYQSVLRNNLSNTPLYIKDYYSFYSTGVFAFDKVGGTKIKILYSKLK